MNFCDNCRNLLIPGEHGLECTDCGNIQEGEISSVEIIRSKSVGEGVVSEFNSSAKYSHTCKKCGYGKAEVIIRDPMISDEDSLTMVQCGKCGKVENLARKMF